MLLFVILCAFWTVTRGWQSTVVSRPQHRRNETSHFSSSLTPANILVSSSLSSKRLSFLESSSPQTGRAMSEREVSRRGQVPIVQHGTGGSSLALQ
ncbi:unnamed protein product, partial [Candidula unifasciata]